jgi:hypothetical protein
MALALTCARRTTAQDLDKPARRAQKKLEKLHKEEEKRKKKKVKKQELPPRPPNPVMDGERGPHARTRARLARFEVFVGLAPSCSPGWNVR